MDRNPFVFCIELAFNPIQCVQLNYSIVSLMNDLIVILSSQSVYLFLLFILLLSSQYYKFCQQYEIN